MKKMVELITIPALVIASTSTLAAREVDLAQQPASYLNSYLSTPSLTAGKPGAAPQVKEISRSVGVSETTHIRLQQLYKGYPVFGADAVMHVPGKSAATRSLTSLAIGPQASKNTVNGKFYAELDADLAKVTATPQALNSEQAHAAAIAAATQLAQKKYGANFNVKNAKSQLMVYVDKAHKAHYAFYVTFFLEPTANAHPAEPIFILDAQSFQEYTSWNNLKSLAVEAGGEGGNESVHFKYDGVERGKLIVDRDPATQICSMQNQDVTVFDFSKVGNYNAVPDTLKERLNIATFPCALPDPSHNHLYWSGQLDAVNGGYSPSNDSLFAGSVVQAMYKTWFQVDMLRNPDKSRMMLNMLVHATNPSTEESRILPFSPFENAFWTDVFQAIFLGDGGDNTYPLTSLGVIAHEVSHGFTAQHSNLIYVDQSGSLNEAFSDMAAQTAELYAYGKSSWQIGSEISKQANLPLRYLDTPSKDCQDQRTPGDACSVDSNSQFAFLEKTSHQYAQTEEERQSYIVHLGSGVFNRAFYLMATAPGWNARTAFTLMVDANTNYWTSSSDFAQAACGVIAAGKERKYDLHPVINAFDQVGIDTKACQ